MNPLQRLAATLVLQMTVEEWTLKVSDGWPDDSPADVAGPAWAGVLPLKTGYAGAVTPPYLTPGIPVPASVRALLAD